VSKSFTTEARRIYRERGDKLENVKKGLPQSKGGIAEFKE
jgi:hypothetical protein